MQFYVIRDWDSLYENNRSRTVTTLAWVPIPNRHDGETFSRIMQHERGAEIFSAFILMVQIASKSKSRGVLMRGNGQPHTAITLSAKCRAPVSWLKVGLDYLTKETDWLEVKEIAVACQDDGGQVTGTCHPTDEERKKGIERTELKGTNGTGFGVLETIKASVNAHFNQPSRHWTEPELRELVVVMKRPNVESELKSVFEYFSKLKPDDQKFFPQSVLKLMEGWPAIVDRASKLPPVKKQLLSRDGIPIGVQGGL